MGKMRLALTQRPLLQLSSFNDSLLMQALGVEIDNRDSIVVDEYSRTSVDNIFAIGDVTNRMALTPVALMEGMAFVSTVFNDKPTKPIYAKVRMPQLQANSSASSLRLGQHLRPSMTML